jgi:hypothetical protein
MPLTSAAYKLWRDGETYEAGRLVYETIPEQEHGQWALCVLALALKYAPASNYQVRWFLRVSRWRYLWFTAHSHFDAIRRVTLKFEKRKQRSNSLTKNDESRYHLCLLAEKVAKVVYNTTDPSGPFDANSGWYIVPALHGLLEVCEDERFNREAESLLFGSAHSYSQQQR